MQTRLKAKIIGFASFDDISSFALEFLSVPAVSALNSIEYTILPGFCDVHVHYREPGFSIKKQYYQVL